LRQHPETLIKQLDKIFNNENQDSRIRLSDTILSFLELCIDYWIYFDKLKISLLSVCVCTWSKQNWNFELEIVIDWSFTGHWKLFGVSSLASKSVSG